MDGHFFTEHTVDTQYTTFNFDTMVVVYYARLLPAVHQWRIQGLILGGTWGGQSTKSSKIGQTQCKTKENYGDCGGGMPPLPNPWILQCRSRNY